MSALQVLNVGDKPRLSEVFQNNGVDADPAVVTLRITKPDGTIVTPSPVKDSLGHYHYDVPIDMAGLWSWEWSGDDNVADEGQFYVRDLVGSADLISVELLKVELDMPLDETDQDAKLAQAAREASAAVRAYTERNFASPSLPATKAYAYDGSGWLDIDDASAITSVMLDGTTLTAGYDYTLGPDRPLTPDSPLVYQWIEVRPGMGQSPEMGFERNLDTLAVYGIRQRYSTVEVTGTFGWPTIPEDVRRATKWVAIEFVTLPQPYTQATIGSFSVDQGRAMNEAIPTRAKELLAPYRRGLY